MNLQDGKKQQVIETASEKLQIWYILSALHEKPLETNKKQAFALNNPTIWRPAVKKYAF